MPPVRGLAIVANLPAGNSLSVALSKCLSAACVRQMSNQISGKLVNAGNHR
jgi:hypothetical protein